MESWGFFHYYTAFWALLVAVAAALVVRSPRRFELLDGRYLEQIARPWKLVVFVIAIVSVTGIAPLTGDPTWDLVDASFMSVSTYLTAPWAVGVFWRAARHRDPQKLYVAAVVALLCASWSYDLYIWQRDGVYPVTWRANIGASLWLYAMAGVLWSLTTREDGRLDLVFRGEEWPDATPETRLAPIVGVAALLALPVAVAMISFLFTLGAFAG